MDFFSTIFHCFNLELGIVVEWNKSNFPATFGYLKWDPAITMTLYNKENPPLMSKVFRKFWDPLYILLVLVHTYLVVVSFYDTLLPFLDRQWKSLPMLWCVCSQCSLMSPQINNSLKKCGLYILILNSYLVQLVTQTIRSITCFRFDLMRK